ncbi:MAG TPA: RluA family pseudouridine synthase [bacterium]|nr:RluA family pseudouridine synthase [bacterium]
MKYSVKKPGELKKFLSLEAGISGKQAKKIIDTRRVFVNGRRVWMASHMLSPGDVVEAAGAGGSKERGSAVIIYEDEYVVAADKPSHMLSDGGEESLEHFLRKNTRNRALRAAHRIDAETSGIVLYAKNGGVFDALKKMWKEKRVKKTYIALAYAKASFDKKTVSAPIGGKPAVSAVKTLKAVKGLSMFEVEIETGRRHQIRIHLAGIGHPVIGDSLYGPAAAGTGVHGGVKRQMLHAARLEYVCPFTKKSVIIKSELPGDFKLHAGLLDKEQK